MLDLAGSLAPIPFYNVQVLSSPHTDDAHRARVAHEVAAVHGLTGLLTLWACQEFFPATERNEGEMTLPDWDMYEEMGMTPEESYHVAKQRLHPTVDIVPNVFTLDNPR